MFSLQPTMTIPFFTWLFLIPIVSCQCLDDQKSLLLQLQNSLQFDEASSTKLVHWNQSGDCCLWKGVYCSQGRVIGLDLSGESISAGLDNSRQIPIAISRLTSLVVLDLSTFDLPVLKLENPTLHMLVRNLEELMELHLDDVNMSAQGKEWCQIISSSLPNLRFFAKFKNLTSLSLTTSGLYDTFSEKIFQVPTLEILDLSNNPLLHGFLPDFPRNRSLRTVVLSKIKFSGTLFDSVAKLTMLSRIDLSSCNFHGSIPYSIANLNQLLYLDMSMNYFTGSISSFSMTKNLTEINLSHNHLTGQITSICWEVLLSLVNLDFRNNSLDGSIPLSLFSLPSLQKLQLSNNQFSRQLQPFSNVSSLRIVDLSFNRLQGRPNANAVWPIPEEIVIDVSYNNLVGTIPEEIGQINSLRVLNLSHNAFTGQIPPSLRKLSYLISLDLSSNKLTGKIPENLIELTLLSTLNLSFNHLVGHIPRMRFHETSYEGNEGLCGFQLHEECKDSRSRLLNH
ncbi:hypothetical protein I3760_09G212400 [Carya illinoinensis]|nr:hypothetical protein I3760_09G212400 [Carya illinoinensis]